MSTRSEIFVRVKPEDFGRVIKCDPSLLKNPLTSTNYPCEEFTIPSNPENGVLYLGIYCHFDGYRAGVGDELIEKFKTYEDVLNLILLGDLSCCLDTIVSYANWRNDPLKIHKIEGEVYNSPMIPYMYVFEDDNWKHSLTYE